jgi:hypothetical protein
MEKNKFIEEISMVAEWYYTKVSENGRGSYSDIERTSSPRVEELGPVIKECKSIAHVCECCGKLAPIKRTHIKQFNKKNDKWRHQCLTCNKRIQL